ncbi:MAG TPA: hypothetical protein VF177_09490 [Anaerolineae bacterium]
MSAGHGLGQQVVEQLRQPGRAGQPALAAGPAPPNAGANERCYQRQ